MLFERLLSEKNFTATEKAIAAYIVQHPQEVLQMGTGNLAQASFTSPAAISRLCKKLELGSFSELKVRLAEEAQGNWTMESINADFPELVNRTTEQIIKTVSMMERYAIRATEELINTPEWNCIVDEIEQAPGIALYGYGYSGNASRNFESNMRRLGYRTTREEDESRMKTWASACDIREFSILISYSGRTMVAIARILKKRQMRSLSITSASTNRLAKLTTYNLPVALIEQRYAHNRMAPLSSTLECSFVLDALYATLFSRHYTENCNKLDYMLKNQGFVHPDKLEEEMERKRYGE